MSPASSEIPIWLGLGNPGKRYEATRHNIGWQCCDVVAEHLKVTFQSTKMGQMAKSPGLTLLRLPGYMNESGAYLKQILTYFRWSLSQVLVIYDDIDYPVGVAKLRQGGGDGGHRGLRSILENFGTENFWRLRLGVGGVLPEFQTKSQKDQFVVDYVLSPFLAEEAKQVCVVFQKILTFLPKICENPKLAMNAFNRE